MAKRILATAMAMACMLSITPSAYGWGATGHMLVAQIARDTMKPATRSEVDRLTKVLAQYAPMVLDFAPAATWMDQIKGYDLRAFNNWHFINTAYNPDNLPNLPVVGQETVVWAIGQALTTLKSTKAADFEKALALRFLIHFAGDIHQPLHCINRYTTSQPMGDRGGNDFPITGAAQTELHAFWDDTANLFPSVDPKSWKGKIPTFAKQIEQAVPKSKVPQWTVSDPNAWAQESYQLAVSNAYANITENSKPSDTYTQQAQAVIRQQLALGGYRLAALLDTNLVKTVKPKPSGATKSRPSGAAKSNSPGK